MKDHNIVSAKFTDGREYVHPDHQGPIVVSVKRGQEAELMAFLQAQTDDGSRRLLALGEARPFRREPFLDELAAWVRERWAGALPIPDAVYRERRGS